VFWGTLHRMILMELLKVFSLALIALTGLILMAGVVSEAMKNGLGPMQILTMIPLLFPSMLPYTVPTTTLFATCLVYGRLSADNEIIALKAAGVHIIHVMWPALFLGIVASAVTLILYMDAIPYTSFILKASLADDIEESLYATLRRDGCIRHAKVNYEIDVKTIQGRKLQDVIFKRRASDGQGFDTIARAQEAELHVDLAQQQILIDMRQCQVIQHNTVGTLDDMVWPVELPGILLTSSTKLRASDMTWLELFEYEEGLQQEKEKLSRDIDSHQLQIDRNRAAPHFRKHVRDQANERQVRDNQILGIQCERHMRPAFALGCVCFALVGCPIGIWFSKNDFLSAFITCFVPIVTIYYPLMLCMINLAHAGKVSPWLCIYNANILVVVAGLILFHRLTRS
jgi:lipopolysaccharide export system permease protein